MCDQLEILNREIERLLQNSSVEEGTLNSDCLQPSVTDSLDIITDPDNEAKYLLEQVFNAMRYSTRVFKSSLFCCLLFVVCFLPFLEWEQLAEGKNVDNIRNVPREGQGEGSPDVDLATNP